jgi:hypothetical protein
VLNLFAHYDIILPHFDASHSPLRYKRDPNFGLKWQGRYCRAVKFVKKNNNNFIQPNKTILVSYIFFYFIRHFLQLTTHKFQKLVLCPSSDMVKPNTNSFFERNNLITGEKQFLETKQFYETE